MTEKKSAKRRNRSSQPTVQKRQKLVLKGCEDCEAYVKKSNDPSLIGFFREYPSHKASTVDFLQLQELKDNWQKYFAKLIRTNRKDLLPQIKALANITCGSLINKEKIRVNMKFLLFQLFYLWEIHPNQVANYLAVFKDAISVTLPNPQQQVLKDYSISLFGKYRKLSKLEKNLLKLSVSNVVNLANPDMVGVYQNLFPAPVFQHLSGVVVADHTPEAVKNTIIATCQDVFTITLTQGYDAALDYIMFKRTALSIIKRRSSSNEYDTEYQVMNVLEYIYNMVVVWQNKDELEEEHEEEDNEEEDNEEGDNEEEDNEDKEFIKDDTRSEAMCLFRVFGLLEKVIVTDKDCCLKVLPGELSSACTKRARIYNEVLFSGGFNSAFIQSTSISSHSDTPLISHSRGIVLTSITSQSTAPLMSSSSRDEVSTPITSHSYIPHISLNTCDAVSTSRATHSNTPSISITNQASTSLSNHGKSTSTSSINQNNTATTSATKYSNTTSPPTTNHNNPSTSATMPGDIKNIFGRKIDLKVTNYEGTEFALCEFKKNNHKPTMTTQQAKSLRLNQCVLSAIQKDHKVFKSIMAFDWGGMTGKMHLLQFISGVSVAIPVANLMLPSSVACLSNQSNLEELQNTLLAFYRWKHHMINLDMEIKAGTDKKNNGSSRESSPSVLPCLSPKH